MYHIKINIQDLMAQQSVALSVVDVYDLAACIGKEFERIIDSHGPEAVTDLMPKVITCLEHLEFFSNRNTKENAEISDLKTTVDKLEQEKSAKAEERAKFEKEIEQIEETWRTETKDLVDAVAALQEDNRRLRDALNEQQQDTNHIERREQELVQEVQLVTKLKETVDTLRNEVKVMKRELAQKNVDAEALQSQVERLAKLNAVYRKKSSVSAKHTRTLITEKADLEMQLHSKDQMITKIRSRLMSDSTEGPSPTSPDSAEGWDNLERRLSLEGKMLIDMKDPNRPRFTLSELRDVLYERNELKAQLIEVEEELHMYKPDKQGEDETEDQEDGTGDQAAGGDSSEDEEYRPVQGPINKEPEEKLNPDCRKESGIRKFFRSVFREKNAKSTKNNKQKKSSMGT